MKYDEELLCKLWLNITCGHNPKLIADCLKKYGSAEEIFNSEPVYKDMISGFRMSRVLRAKRSLESAEELLEFCEKSGIRVISASDKEYPNSLLHMYAPPLILYVKGQLPDFNNLICVAIVGSRECSEYSAKFANELSYDLASSGIIVISGMAKGIDAAAHRGALEAGNITVAALAGGVDVIYPACNTGLYNNIIKNGAVISERPPQTVGRGNFYKERNRILVGLSKGVVIVEGEEKSGTKLTASWALDADRDLFAVPGKPSDIGSELPNNLIKRNAKLITSAEDIIEEYIAVYPIEIKNGIDLINEERKTIRLKDEIPVAELPRPQKPDFDKFDEKSRIILEYIYNNNKEVHIDEISRDCDIPATELSFLIIRLLMERAVREHPGEYYSINH